jgi:hypothetical protein
MIKLVDIGLGSVLRITKDVWVFWPSKNPVPEGDLFIVSKIATTDTHFLDDQYELLHISGQKAGFNSDEIKRYFELAE